MVKRGFTLLEVLLSVAVMSSGVLTVVVLYSLGFRETRQSNEDIASAAYADAILAPMVNALSATNIAWSAFNNIQNTPSEGWRDYYDGNWKIRSDCNSIASRALGAVKSAGASGVSWPSIEAGDINGGLKAAGLVVRHETGSSVVKIAFRAARSSQRLMSAPLYYTEVQFQGDPTK